MTKMRDLEQILVNTFKFNLYAAKVYLTLLRGEMTAKDASDVAGIPQARIYNTLRSLEREGFVRRSGERYSAVSPSAALESRVSQFETLFREEQLSREQTKEHIIGMLDAVYSRGRDAKANEILLTTGISSIGAQLMETLLNSNDIFFSVRKAIAARDSLIPYIERSSKGKRIRVLLSSGLTLSKDDLKLARRMKAELRRSSGPFLDVLVADDREVAIGVPDPLSEEPHHAIAVWIRNRSFASSVKEIMEELWERGEVLIHE